MNERAWKVGTIGGVEIRVDPSWSLIAFLVAYSFYLIVSQRFPDERATLVVPLSIGMAVVFFAAVLTHELSHAWLARARGIEVTGITLFLFGGSTHARLEQGGPDDELAIAAVGPLSSLAISGVLWGLTLLAGDGPIAFATGRLGWINLALAVFNLLPGFPLDGGRILRALIWKSTGDLRRATRSAARTGQMVGWGLAALGILEVMAGGLFGGLWLVAIGWFLGQSAQAGALETELQLSMADFVAADIMSRQPVELPAELPLDRAVDEHFMRHDFNAYPVTEDGRPVGILTLRAVRRVPRHQWGTVTVGDTMEPVAPAALVGPDEPMEVVLGEITSGEVARVLVADQDGRLIGLITPRDLTRWLERSRQLGVRRG